MLTTREPVRTERLVLRALREDDLDAVVALHTDPDTIRYLPWPLRTREQSAEWLRERADRDRLEHDGDVVVYAVALHGSDALSGIGVLFLHSVEHAQAEIGYALLPAVQGRGLGTELGRALLDLAFDRLAAHRVTAQVDPRNAASERVAARLGMRREGVHRHAYRVRGEWTDTAVWAVLEEERPA